jgi:Squalene-hopene cyclase C-terminal domain/Prenyltransferase and squalene oxidase repeat
MITRRDFLLKTGAAMSGFPLAVHQLGGADRDKLPDGSASKDMITPEAQRAIDKGLGYLASRQNGDGTFGNSANHSNVAITSLCGLGFMAGGHQPGRGIYGEVVTRALRYVISCDDQNGYLISKQGSFHGPMYGHGFGTLFLAEAHGMVHDKELRQQLRDTVKRAVGLIVKAQNNDGGWRYYPESRDADVSVTICQIMALRAARNAGFAVPKATVDHCTEYVKKCQNSDGGFQYQLQNQPGPSQFARSAAGVVALHCAGIYNGPVVEKGLKYLMGFKPGQGHQRPEMHMHYYYGHYYAAQAMWTAGGQYWAQWYPAIRDELVHLADRNTQAGYWSEPRFSNEYATAMACIILQIPNNYLPILQK